MRVRTIFAGLVVALWLWVCVPASAQLMSGCWPKFHSNSSNNGLSSASGPASNLQGWSFSVGGAVTGDPVTDSSGNIYFVSQDSLLYSLTRDGVFRWQFTLQSTGRGAPAIASNGNIYAGSDLPYLYALSATGTLKWRKLLGGKLGGSPAIGTDGTIYAPCVDGKLYAFDSLGGQKWAYATGGALRSSPAMSGSVVYVGSDDTYLYAINSSGTLKWKYKCPSSIPNAPAVGSDGTIYAACSSGALVAVNSGGTLKWRYDAPAQIASSPAIGPNGTIYFGAENSRLYAITSTGSLSWTFQSAGPMRSSPAVGGNGVVYVGSEDGSIYSVRPDGSLMWSADLGGAVTSSPAIGSDGTLLVGAGDGQLHTFPPDSTPPSTPIVTYDGVYSTSSTSLSAAWTSYDDESGIAESHYAIGTTPGGKQILDWTSAGGEFAVTHTGLSLVDGTTYYVSVKTKNGAGLWSEVGTSDGIIVDASPASTPVVADDGVYTTTATSLHATWSASDPQSGVVEYKYAIGTSAGGTNIVDWTSVGVSTEITKTGLSLVDGAAYYISVMARNGAGLWSAVGSSDGIICDTTPPSVPVVTDGGEYTSTTTTLNASWASSDPHSGIAEYQYAIGTSAGAADVVNWTTTGVTSVNRSGLSLESGKTYYFSVKAKNKAGVWSAVGISDGIICDATPPSVPVVVDDGAFTSSTTTLHASWSSADDESGVASYQYAIGTTPGSANTVNWTSIGAATEVSRTGLSLISGTTYYISVKATNGAGLVSSVGSSDGITVDTTPPVTPVVTDDGVYTTTATSLHATWSASDPQSGVVEYKYAIGTSAGGTNIVDWTSVGVSTEITKTGLSLVDGAAYYISVMARNGAGLWSAVGSSDGIIVDSSPPTTPLVVDDGDFTTSPTLLHATWSASDPHTGIAEYQYAIGTSLGATDVVGWTSVGTTASVTRNDITLIGGTTYYFAVKARNKAGLWSSIGTSDGITCDGTPPTTPVVIDDGAYTADASKLHAAWSSNDPESGIVEFQYAVGTIAGAANTIGWTSVGTDTELNLTGLSLAQNVTYYISVKARNGSGMWGAIGSSDGIKVDPTPPNTPVVIRDGAYSTSAGSLRATWSSEDPESGIQEYQYAIGTSAGGTEVVNWTSAGIATSITRSGLSLVDGQIYYFSVKARNGAGLWSAVGRGEGITVDASPPSTPIVTDDGNYTMSTTTLHANWSSQDPHTGIAAYEYAIGTSAGATDVVGWTAIGTQTQVTVTNLTLAPGAIYFFCVRAKNAAGLWSDVGTSDGIGVDQTPPSAPVVSDEGEYTSSMTALSARWEAIDAESGIANYQYCIGTIPGGTDIVAWTSANGASHITHTGLTLALDVTYYFSVKAKNKVGLWGPVGVSDGIEVRILTTWPKFRNDSTNLGASPFTGPNVPGLLSAYTTGAGIVSSPAIAGDGTVYFGNDEGYMHSLGPNGILHWRYKTGGPVDSSPAIGPNGDIVFASYDSYIYCLTIDGALRWRYKTNDWSRSSPSIGPDNTVYVGSQDGYFYAIKWTGKLKWKHYIGDTIWSSPALNADGSAVYFGGGDGGIYCLSTETGAQIWRKHTGTAVDSSPCVAPNGTIYQGSGDGYFYALNPDGSQKWALYTADHMDSSAAIGPSGTIYAGSGDDWSRGLLYAINPDGSVKWTFNANGSIRTSPAVDAAEVIYFGSTDNYLYAVNPTGTLKWKYRTDGPLHSSPAIGRGGTIYIGSNLGTMLKLGDSGNDITPPSTPVVAASVSATDPTSLSADWMAWDPESGIAEYMFAIGTTKGGDDITGWTSVGTAVCVVKSRLPLTIGQVYYFSVKARNGAGIWGTAGVSDGITVVGTDQPISIGCARQISQPISVNLRAKIVSAVFEDCLYITERDGYAGIKVKYAPISPPAIGSEIDLSATICLDEPEPALCLINYTTIGHVDDLRPIGLGCSALVGAPPRPGLPQVNGATGTCTLGVLAVIWGKVSTTGSGWVYVDDGSNIVDPSGARGVKVMTQGQILSVGTYVRVVGIISVVAVNSSYRVLVRTRSEADIMPIDTGNKVNPGRITD